MGKSGKWHRDNPRLYSETLSILADKYPTLNMFIREEEDKVFIRGTYTLYEGTTIIDRFLIEIEFPDKFPREEPILREVGSRFDISVDRHFIDAKGTACPFLADERYVHLPEAYTIEDFIEGPVKNFFLWQLDFDLNGGRSTLQQYSHGLQGRLEFYNGILKTNDKQIVYKFLQLLLKGKVRGHNLCFCGNKKKIRNCGNHYELLLTYKKKIPKHAADASFRQLQGSMVYNSYADRIRTLIADYNKDTYSNTIRFLAVLHSQN